MAPHVRSCSFTKSVACIVGLGAVHYVVQAVMIMVLFSAGIHRFDMGAAPTGSEHVLEVINTLWMLPLKLPLLEWLPGRPVSSLAGHVILFTNGLCWGTLFVLGWRWHVRTPESS